MAGHEHPIAHRVIPTESPSLIKAALHVLADGRARDAGDVLSEAVKAGLLPDSTRRITLYTSSLRLRSKWRLLWGNPG